MSRIPMLGIYPDISNEEYHADKGYISRSALMDFDKSPYTYWAKHINPDRPQKDATLQMQLGSAFHTLILEPHLFSIQYGTEPEKVLLKDVGRPKYELYKAECELLEKSGRIVLTYEETQNLFAMEKKIRSSNEAMQLLENARIENSFFWRDKESGLLLKARPDILHPSIIVDLKTAADASPRAFQNSMIQGGYHIQMAMIRDAVEAIEGRRISYFINIVIENKYPHNIGIYLIDEYAIEVGETKYKQICLDLKNATAENKWNDYGIQTISLPKWAL